MDSIHHPQFLTCLHCCAASTRVVPGAKTSMLVTVVGGGVVRVINVMPVHGKSASANPSGIKTFEIQASTARHAGATQPMVGSLACTHCMPVSPHCTGCTLPAKTRYCHLYGQERTGEGHPSQTPEACWVSTGLCPAPALPAGEIDCIRPCQALGQSMGCAAHLSMLNRRR